MACAAAMAPAAVARAGGEESSKPWYAGVTAERQAEAQALFEEGNRLFTERAYSLALEKYRAAVALWDHPLIRFNLAVTEIRLERILEAAADLEQALRFGEQPFTPELFAQAQDYQVLLGKQLGVVTATCDQAGASVLLDGKAWFACPGTARERVLAGEHTLVTSLTGYLTDTRRVVVTGGQVAEAAIKLMPLESAIVVTYRHPRWLPYTVTGAGAAVSLLGLGVWAAGRSQMREFDENFKAECSTTGCDPSLADYPALASQRDSAAFKGTAGIATMVVGGAALVGGVVWTVLNRPQRRLPTLEVAPTDGGVSAGMGWRF